VLVGDAYGFLDPLYSSGGLLALRSGAMAADCVCEFYDGFNFGRFVKKHPHLKGHHTDLLIGDLFTDAVDDVIAPIGCISY